MTENEQMKHFKFTDSMLLELALKQLKLTKKQFQIQQHRFLNLNKVTFVGEVETPTQKTFPTEDTKIFAKEHIFSSETHLIKTTKYGRIKSVEAKPKANPTKPVVIIKQKRKIEKNENWK